MRRFFRSFIILGIQMRKILFKSNCIMSHDRNKHPLAFNIYLLDLMWPVPCCPVPNEENPIQYRLTTDKAIRNKRHVLFPFIVINPLWQFRTLFNQFQCKLNALIFHSIMKYFVGNFHETFAVSWKALFQVCIIWYRACSVYPNL